MNHTKTTLTALRAGIPPEKFAVKVKRTLTGLFLAALTAGSVALFDAPWWVGVAGGLLAATIWSGEIVTGALKVLVGVFKDVWASVKGAPPA